MKKFLLSASVAIAVICFTSCDKIKELIPPFDIEIPAVPVIIQAQGVTSGEVTLGTGSADFDIDAEIKKYAASVSISNVTSVKVKKVVISTSGTSTQNLSNFSTARILLATNANATEIQVASTTIEDIATAQKTITPTDSPELKSYLTGSHYTFSVKGIVRRQITTPMTVMLATTVTVKP